MGEAGAVQGMAVAMTVDAPQMEAGTEMLASMMPEHSDEVSAAQAMTVTDHGAKAAGERSAAAGAGFAAGKQHGDGKGDAEPHP